jgi:hypothetical protein
MEWKAHADITPRAVEASEECQVTPVLAAVTLEEWVLQPLFMVQCVRVVKATYVLPIHT